jgi:uncharacterized membrane protein
VVLLALVLRWESAQHTITRLASRCAISEAIDCDKVQASSYASVLGVSLAVWAAVGHLILIGWLLAGRLVLAGVLAVFNLLLALFLAYVSFVEIGAVCLYCSGMQLGILALAILVVPMARKAKPGGLALPALLAGLFVFLGFTGEAYARERSNLLRETHLPDVGQLRMDVVGSPILGNPTTPNSALLFLDFGCPVCKACYAKAAGLVRRFPQRIHFIIKHYPLDGTCNKYEPGEFHRGACNAASTSSAAAFFGLGHGSRAVHELMQMSPDFLPVALDRLGKVTLRAKDWNWKSAPAIRTVLRDIEDGRALKISSVPQGFLNGRPRDPNRIDQWYKSFLE